MAITAEYLRHLLHYDPLTGLWTWVNPLPHSKVRRGDPAGRVTSRGYRQLRIASGYYVASRMAFLYMTGFMPKEEVDHINRIKDDDRWENLREASRSQNAYNRDWCEEGGDLRGIRCCGKQFAVSIGGQYLGLFATIEEAIAIRDQALKEFAGPFAIKHERNAG